MNQHQLTEKYITAGGFKTRYLEGGSVDGVPVVLLHDGGWGARAETTWGGVAPILLEAGYRLLVPDLLGFGGTEKAYFFDKSPVAFRMKHVADFCAAVGCSSAHFVGTSFGGTLLMRALAAKPCPWPVASACSIAGTGGPWRVPEAMGKLADFDGSVDSIARLVSMIAEPGYPGFDSETYIKERHASALVPGHYAALSAARLQAPWEQSAQSAQADAYPGSLQGCEIPLMLIEPEQDPTCQPGWPSKIKEVLPEAEVQTISGRHSPNVDRPELVARMLLGWLDRVGSRKAEGSVKRLHGQGKALTETIVSLLKDAEFRTLGLRDYFEYRDLGVSEATEGRFVARVVRAHAGLPVTASWHVHYADFRLLYVLKGWLKFHYKDRGTFQLSAGDAIFQAPDPHAELEHSEDVEVLEVASPADFSTDDVS
ncbi:MULTISPECIES: alpha/beta fold hydrolase [unclassified Variovorax]|uniref:alpha/beta fold hydrolase n=1 Tax=unclassified Variovorax TaxID=663243 RepID=UPI000A762CBB|nr:MULTISPECIES: alpha/beta fold hydrolase [unclassified Variovorax]PNG48887.1 2-hydroxy-6-oxo-6-(2'-aminophenyl)hexa-2,4-dienoic acid hydrolase [Variovorax sp. B2]PNG49394.1 2-hydroxy-6-oxo-6-(2'-aminophenyl)hexa-2,4-dienoic acid hydrolase [Variovorax sp. B4]VTV18302.1 Lipase 1 precursor [Variovorax sp. WDL1]